MKNLRVLSLLLAAILQLAPLCRIVVTNPAVTSTFAIIFRWGIGAAATLGAFDAVSGATNVLFTNPTNTSGYVNVPFKFFVTITNFGSDPGATFSANPLPTGLSISNYDHYPQVYGVIYGTPTVATNKMQVFLVASYPGQPSVFTNLYIMITNAVAPVITNPPVSQTVTAGYNALFNVVAGGIPPPQFQWRFNNADLATATNSSLTLTNARMTQAGSYTVVVSNIVNALTSPAAQLTMSLPAQPLINVVPGVDGKLRFSFVPAVGLTNSVQTNGLAASGGWNPLTNIPPPASATTVTITNVIDSPTKFFQIKVAP